MRLLILPVMFSIPLLIQCKSVGKSSSVKAAVNCSIEGSPTPDSLVAATQTSCNTDFEAMMTGAGCTFKGRALVSETAHYFASDARTIDLFICGEEDVWFSHPDEFITTIKEGDDTIHQFYKGDGGNFKFLGNSFDDHQCKKCHTHGELNMKELLAPWANWDSERISQGGMRLKNRDDLLKGKPRLDATGIEGKVKVSQRNIASAKIKRMMAGQPPFENVSVKDALTPLFCETTVELISADPKGQGALEGSDESIPHGFVINSELEPFSYKLNMKKWKKTFENRGIGVKPAERSDDPDALKIGLFPFITPKRPAMDTSYAQELWTQKVIDSALFFSALLVDFRNPIFSKMRCGIVGELPTTPIKNFATAAALREELQSRFSSSSLPGARLLGTYLQESASANLANAEGVASFVNPKIQPYLEKCKTNKKSFINNLDDLYLTLRARTARAAELPIMEDSAFAMFPEGEKLKSPELKEEGQKFQINEQCELEKGS
ncbi:MAG: hypothetical protein AB7T49_16225 [Oligoflexales bacterium]